MTDTFSERHVNTPIGMGGPTQGLISIPVYQSGALQFMDGAANIEQVEAAELLIERSDKREPAHKDCTGSHNPTTATESS